MQLDVSIFRFLFVAGTFWLSAGASEIRDTKNYGVAVEIPTTDIIAPATDITAPAKDITAPTTDITAPTTDKTAPTTKITATLLQNCKDFCGRSNGMKLSIYFGYLFIASLLGSMNQCPQFDLGMQWSHSGIIYGKHCT